MPETTEGLDAAVRMAAFAFLEDRLSGVVEETLSFEVLRSGFIFRGGGSLYSSLRESSSPPCSRKSLTITTAPPKHNKPAPYDDISGPDGTLLYRYRGQNPMHHENVGLRRAMTRKAPLVYLRGIVPGRYLPEWPVYNVGDGQS